MGVLEYFDRSPYLDLIGIEITEAEDGYAEGRLSLEQQHSSSPNKLVAQGGVAFTLADAVGGAASISAHDHPTPTIDFRIDYYRPGTDDLFAQGEVVRDGRETAVVEVDVLDPEGREIAAGRGVYKTSGLPEDAEWDQELFE